MNPHHGITHMNKACNIKLLASDAMVTIPLIAIANISAPMYKWEQIHIEADSVAEDYVFTSKKEAYRFMLMALEQKQSNDVLKKVLPICDDNMLY
jgi:hypothetical protein